MSSTENTTPLVVKEALICGLGVVVSEDVSVELDISEDFIDVIPESNIDDLDIEYLNEHIQTISDQKHKLPPRSILKLFFFHSQTFIIVL